MSKGRNRESTVDTAAPALAELEERLDYRFARPDLLDLALTHRSFPYEASQPDPPPTPARPVSDGREQRNPPGADNEQLEFLGDAVLGLAITEALYAEFPECSEGELTRLRASLVSRQRMATMGNELGLGDHLRLGRSAEQNGSRRKPAILANTAEAVIAAMYLDALQQDRDTRNGLGAVRRLVERYLLAPERDGMKAALAASDGRGAMRDHKTLLQERVQAEGAGRLRYIDTAESGPAHQRRFAVAARLEKDGEARILAEAEGSSKKEAQQRAAEIALAQWNQPSAEVPADTNGSAA